MSMLSQVKRITCNDIVKDDGSLRYDSWRGWTDDDKRIIIWAFHGSVRMTVAGRLYSVRRFDADADSMRIPYAAMRAAMEEVVALPERENSRVQDN